MTESLRHWAHDKIDGFSRELDEVEVASLCHEPANDCVRRFPELRRLAFPVA